MRKAIVLLLILIGLPCLAISGAYWWSNVPPRRPQGVSASGVFLWAGHLGLPASKHGTWIECWTDAVSRVNKCRLTEMDGRPGYEGVFVADTGRSPVPGIRSSDQGGAYERHNELGAPQRVARRSARLFARRHCAHSAGKISRGRGEAGASSSATVREVAARPLSAGAAPSGAALLRQGPRQHRPASSQPEIRVSSSIPKSLAATQRVGHDTPPLRL